MVSAPESGDVVPTKIVAQNSYTARVVSNVKSSKNLALMVAMFGIADPVLQKQEASVKISGSVMWQMMELTINAQSPQDAAVTLSVVKMATACPVPNARSIEALCRPQKSKLGTVDPV
eukprot:gnl/MRDRNA2_/MRDRNA2_367127_c0_seq1.p4 gnl/MRDRNA2_/MRDRNA2_367127_c0~~gnl/MRDRNA2_/MRDRNA2_367127_c0_seq1.p4  ORF type:complete len:118 (+),score=29.24 gnl/MRDRNA2_/MRDRNA2_367127_c0_seq1:50-403(+)